MKSIGFARRPRRCSSVAALVVVASVSVLCIGQDARSQEFELELTAITANVSRADRPVDIDIARWSTQSEREAIVTAWTEPESTSAEDDSGGGFGGRGRGGGGGDSESAPVTPVEAVTTALEQARSHGHLWTDGPVGYQLKYAVRSPLPNGGERIVLATGRRLDAHTSDWTPTTAAAPTDYAFTLIEIRLDANGAGVGRTSLTTEVTLDEANGALVLDDYAAAPVIFDNVAR